MLYSKQIQKMFPLEIFTILDLSHPTTSKFMSDIDKKFNKEVTTRTWKTIEKIVMNMSKTKP